MAAYSQFGYGNYPPASQPLPTNSTQSSSSNEPPIPVPSLSNAPAISPSTECRTNAAVGDTSSGALSPDEVSQNSNNASGALSQNPASVIGSSLVSQDHVALSSSGSCCENGRPIMTDPVSGQSVCSCQYDSARLAFSSYSRLPAAGVGVYGTPYPSTDQNPYQSIGVDSSAFYSPLNNPYALKDTSAGTEMTAWTSAGLQPTTGYYSYDPMSAYGYGAGYDLAARRKNATRESTATLKAWLNEHKKNPYPTKGEKIMLAIITKMTLTQVSTWFANARRRLKKENKMTWEPKNRTDDDDALVSDEEKDKDDLEPNSKPQSNSGSLHQSSGGSLNDSIGGGHPRKEGIKVDNDDEVDERKLSYQSHDVRGNIPYHGGPYHGNNPISHPHGYHPYHQPSSYYQQQHSLLAAGFQNAPVQDNNVNKTEGNDPKNQLSRDCGESTLATKPKIWSLADTVACKTPPPAFMGQSHHQPQHHQHRQFSHMDTNRSPMDVQQQKQQLAHPHPTQQQQQQHAHQQQQAHQHLLMGNYNSAVATAAAAVAYSRPPTTGYENFLQTTIPLNHSNNASYNNSNNTARMNNINNPSHYNATHTPIAASIQNTSDHHQQHPLSRKILHPQQVDSQSMGFPEVQPDTPPQTPPNMKVSNLATNLLLTATQANMIASCHTNPDIPSFANHHIHNYSTHIDDYSPRDESCSSTSTSSPSQTTSNAFEPLFKSQPVYGFAPPV